MPPPRRFARVIANHSIPRRTRLGLLAAEARRRLRPRSTYEVPYAGGTVYLSHDDYEIDWETLKNTVVDEPYLADYRDALVLDIGAHKGYFAAYAVAHGAAAVVSYEPATDNALLLERSASTVSAHAEWTAHRAAVSDDAGVAELHLLGASWGHSLHPPEAFSQYETGVESVVILPMAEVLRTAAARKNGSRLIVKINTEGEECATVLGTPSQEWEVVDELLVETHPWASCGADELAAHLEPAGLRRVTSRHERMLQLRREHPRLD